MPNNNIELQKQLSTAIDCISKQVMILSDKVEGLTREVSASTQLNQLVLSTALLALQSAGQQATDPAAYFDHISDRLAEAARVLDATKSSAQVLALLKNKIVENEYIDFSKPIPGVGNPHI